LWVTPARQTPPSVHQWKMVSPPQRRRAADMLQVRLGLSQRRTCQIVGQHRSTQRHRPEDPDPDRDLRRALRDFARHHPRWGDDELTEACRSHSRQCLHHESLRDAARQDLWLTAFGPTTRFRVLREIELPEKSLCLWATDCAERVSHTKSWASTTTDRDGQSTPPAIWHWEDRATPRPNPLDGNR
jgi:hypothetical protein